MEPGEEKTIEMTLTKRAFAWYDPERKDWYASSGEYEILVGSSSAKILLRECVEIAASRAPSLRIDSNTPIGDLLKDPALAPIIAEYQKKIAEAFGQSDSEASKEAISEEMTYQMIVNLPLRSLRSFLQLQPGELEALVKRLQEARKEA